MRDGGTDMKAYQILLWDIDGTILNFKAAEKHAFSACITRFFNIPCTDEMHQRYSALNETFWQKLERGEMTRDQILTERFTDFFRREGLPQTDPVRFNALYHSLLPETIVFNDDCKSMLEEFSSFTKQYAVTNGTKSVQDPKLKKSGLGTIFDDVFISEVIGYEKPSSSFFDYVFAHIPSVPKESILLIGDSLTSDIKGAVTAGIDCCWYNPERKPVPDNPKITYFIQDLRELRDIVTPQ